MTGTRASRAFVLTVLLFSAAWSVVPLAVILLRAHGDTWLGSDYTSAVDHLHYMAWIREAAQHVLVSDRYDIPANPPVYLHPLFALSGLLVRAGLDLRLALLVWKPVAVVVFGGGVALYARARLTRVSDQVAAVVLGCFVFAPLVTVMHLLGLGSAALRGSTEFFSNGWFPASLLWGYYPATMALGLLALGLLCVERALTVEPPRWRVSPLLLGAACGLLASWLHPWQGTTLLLCIGGLWAWARLDKRMLRLWPMVVATLLPLIYYGLLSQLSPAFARVSRMPGLPRFEPGMVLAFAPLLLLAIPGMAGHDLGTGDRLLRLWPLAGLATYGLQLGYIYHALLGLGIPLAILTVQGWSRLRLTRPVGAIAVGLAFLLGLAPMVQGYRDSLHARTELYLVRDDRRALAFLERAPGGSGVFAPYYLGKAVPAFTGRNVWLGDQTQTPDFYARLPRVEAVFSGAATPAEAQAIVAESGAGFVLSGCFNGAAADTSLAPLVVATHRFGCASVIEVRMVGLALR